MFVECDVRDEEGVKGAIEKVEGRWGAGGLGREVGGLVHCAGIGMAGKVSWDSDGLLYSLRRLMEWVGTNDRWLGMMGTLSHLMCSEKQSVRSH